jgi:hypothetical protein
VRSAPRRLGPPTCACSAAELTADYGLLDPPTSLRIRWTAWPKCQSKCAAREAGNEFAGPLHPISECCTAMEEAGSADPNSRCDNLLPQRSHQRLCKHACLVRGGASRQILIRHMRCSVKCLWGNNLLILRSYSFSHLNMCSFASCWVPMVFLAINAAISHLCVAIVTL